MSLEMSEISDVVVSWLATEGLVLGRNLLVVAVILVAAYVTARLARRAVASAMERSHLSPSPLFQQFVKNAASNAIWVVAIIVALGNLGVDTAALIAGLGVSGLVLGFALQDSLSNFASGMLILLYEPFDVGDFVELDDTIGKVTDLTLVSTIVTTPDNKTVTFPNSKVWGNPIVNFTATGTRRIDLVVGVAYDADVDAVTEIFLDVLDENDEVLDDPEPMVMMAEMADSSVDFFVRGWVPTEVFWPVRSELLRQIKYRLDAEDVTIPFPQREVWMHEVGEAIEGEGAEVATAQ